MEEVSQGGGERRETEVSEVSQGGWETEMSQGGGEDQNISPVRTLCGRRRRRAITSSGDRPLYHCNAVKWTSHSPDRSL